MISTSGAGFRIVFATMLLTGLLVGNASTSHVGAQSEPIECEVPPAIESDQSGDEDESTPRQVLQSGLETLVRSYARCLSDGNFETMSRLVTEKYLGETYGGGPRLSRASFLALAGTLPSPLVRYRDLNSVSVLENGNVRANVKLVVGNQLTYEQLVFIEDSNRPGRWLIDSASPLRVQPPREHTDIAVEIVGDQFVPAQLTAAGPNIEIRITNTDLEDHEFMLLKLADGASVGSLLVSPGSGLPQGFEYLAQITVPGGETSSLVLVNMQPGAYTVVDLLPTETGVPHLAVGMQATLTITE